MSKEIVGFDTETELMRPGLRVPKPIVYSLSTARGEALLFPDRPRQNTPSGFDAVGKLLTNPNVIIVGANLAFDVCVDVEGIRRVHGDQAALDRLKLWVKKYDDGLVGDVSVNEQLHAIANGHLGKDPTTGQDLRTPEGKMTYYSLECVTYLNTGSWDAKINDYWRKRYAILDKVDLSLWPAEGRQYPLDDARNTRVSAIEQETKDNRFVRILETRAGLWLMASEAHGLRTSKAATDAIEDRVKKKKDEGRQKFLSLGFLREVAGEITENKSQIKKVLAEVYGAKDPCKVCKGAGRVPSFTKNGKPTKDGRTCIKQWGGKVIAGSDACDGTGLDLTPTRGKISFTDAGGIQAGREFLFESGHEDLMAYAVYSEDNKTETTFLGLLRKGHDQPYNPKSRLLVESGRSAMGDGLHSIPRKGGIREAFRPRYGFVYCSSDYSAIEMCTLGQTLLDMVGWSKLAEIINETKDPGALHTKLGARLKGVETIGKKDPFRDAAKAFNFGLPGGMGVATFVISKRKEDATTTCPDGHVYRGLRFCVLIGGQMRCGLEKTTRWGTWAKKDHSPVCVKCCEAVAAAKEVWFAQYPEMRSYFKLVQNGGDRKGRVIRGCKDMDGDDGIGIVEYGGMRRGGLTFTNAANCVDYKTEALTDRGWLNGKDIKLTDKLLTKNASTGALEWQYPTAVNHFPDYTGPLVEFKSKSISALTTPNHRWLVNETRNGNTRCVTSETLSKTGSHGIHRTGVYTEGKETYSDDFVELVGWFLTDGSRPNPKKQQDLRVYLYQSQRANPEKVARIDALIKRLELPVKRADPRPESGAVVWAIKGPVAHKIRELFPVRELNPEFLNSISARQANLLIDVMILGDGSVTDNGRRSLCTGRENQAKNFQTLCTLAGFTSKMEWRDMSKYQPKSKHLKNIPVSKGIWMVHILARKHAQIVSGQHCYHETSTGGVWCPTVPNTYFVARREGRVYITGNTSFQGLAARGVKDAMWHLGKEMYTVEDSPLFGSRIALFFHDDIVSEIPETLCHEAALRQSQIMVDRMRVWVPDVHVECEPTPTFVLSKAMSTTYDAGGRMVPWAPKDWVDDRPVVY